MKLTHKYISTACQHDLCDRCRKTCKFCNVRCICTCHEWRGELEMESSARGVLKKFGNFLDEIGAR